VIDNPKCPFGFLSVRCLIYIGKGSYIRFHISVDFSWRIGDLCDDDVLKINPIAKRETQRKDGNVIT